MSKLHGLIAEYPDAASLVRAARAVRDAGFRRWDCYSPYPIHGIDPAMGIRPTRLPVVVFALGLTGCAAGFLLQWWTNAHDWPWNVSGKPIWSWPANVPIAFELTILLAAFTAFFGMWIANKLPAVWHPLFSKDRFRKVTTDGFFLAIEADDARFERDAVARLLQDSGAGSVEPVFVPDDPEARKLPRPLVAFMILSGVAAIVPFAYIARAREARSAEPRWHVIPNMDFQPKRKAQTAARPNPPGTIARGALADDDHLYRGVVDGAWSTTLPAALDVTDALVAQGRADYDVYCAPCHGASGHGDGMVARRAEELRAAAWTPPTSLHSEYVVRMPHGQLMHTIGHGARSMRGYADKLSPVERWGVVLYVRALQRSQAALAADVAADHLQRIR